MKTEYRVGGVYSGYFSNAYVAFEITGEKPDYAWIVEITCSTDEETMTEGKRTMYKGSNFFHFGKFEEVATDYKQAKIDLLLDLRQEEWFREEVSHANG